MASLPRIDPAQVLAYEFPEVCFFFAFFLCVCENFAENYDAKIKWRVEEGRGFSDFVVLQLWVPSLASFALLCDFLMHCDLRDLWLASWFDFLIFFVFR